MKDLKSLADEAKKSVGSGVVAIANASPDGKAGIVVGVTDRSDRALQRGRFRARRQREAGRQGRRRPARHGAGWRPGRCVDRRGARGDRRRAARESQRMRSEEGLASGGPSSTTLRRRLCLLLDGGARR